MDSLRIGKYELEIDYISIVPPAGRASIEAKIVRSYVIDSGTLERVSVSKFVGRLSMGQTEKEAFDLLCQAITTELEND